MQQQKSATTTTKSISSPVTTTKKVAETKPTESPTQLIQTKKKVFQLGSLRSDLIQKSVFKRIDVGTPITKVAQTNAKTDTKKTLVKTISMSSIKTQKSRISPIDFSSPKNNVTITVKNTEPNRKIVPITLSSEPKKPLKLSSVVKPVQHTKKAINKRPDRTIFSRISL